MTSLTQLAEENLANAKRLDKYLASNGLPFVSFDHDSFENFPPELQGTRNEMKNTLKAMKDLVTGPIDSTTEILHSPADITSLRMIYLYRIPQAVDLNGFSTYEEISSKTGLSKNYVYRFLRHAMVHQIFAEPTLGQVRHTAITRLMVEDPDFFDIVGMKTCDLAPALMELPNAFAKWPNTGSLNETAYGLTNNTRKSFFEHLADTPERARRFDRSMKFSTRGSAHDIKHLTSRYDWAALDRPNALLVDVGGGHGSVAQHLADTTKHMTFVVQDLPGTVKQGADQLPAKYKSRIEFAGHDMFKEQPVKGADIYFFRWIFHSYSDALCVKMLQNLVPAMKHGTKILLFEMLLPVEAKTTWAEKISLDTDIYMASLFNSRERNINDWRILFENADARFYFQGITEPPGSSLCIVEAEWQGELRN